jgi:hypothetical protein
LGTFDDNVSSTVDYLMKKWGNRLDPATSLNRGRISRQSNIRAPRHSPDLCRSGPGASASNFTQFSTFGFFVSFRDKNRPRVHNNPAADNAQEVEFVQQDRLVNYTTG